MAWTAFPRGIHGMTVNPAQPSKPDRPSSEHRPALQPPRFSLGTLLLITAVLCGCLAAWQALLRQLAPAATGPATIAAIVFALAVLAHLAGGVLGHQLRRNGDTALDDVPAGTRRAGEHVPPAECAPVTKLSRQVRLSWLLAIPVILGAAAGAAVGVWLLGVLYTPRVPWENLLFGAGSCSVLGGFLGFGGSTLVLVLGGAIREAQRDRCAARQ